MAVLLHGGWISSQLKYQAKIYLHLNNSSFIKVSKVVWRKPIINTVGFTNKHLTSTPGLGELN